MNSRLSLDTWFQTLSNSIAELSLRTTWHVTRHVARDKLDLDVLRVICTRLRPGHLKRTCWRQFAVQWAECKKPPQIVLLNAIIIIIIIIIIITTTTIIIIIKNNNDNDNNNDNNNNNNNNNNDNHCCCCCYYYYYMVTVLTPLNVLLSLSFVCLFVCLFQIRLWSRAQICTCHIVQMILCVQAATFFFPSSSFFSFFSSEKQQQANWTFILDTMLF